MKKELRTKQGPTRNCKEKGCNGKPKKLIEATTFNGTICENCMCTHMYEPLKSENQVNKEERLKQKTLITTEDDIEAAIAAADKKEKKKKKSNKGEQLNLL